MNGCNNCAKRRDIQKECPWGGRYLHHVEHGEGIGICGAYRKEKNADRIRAMSDEELAEFLCDFRSCNATTHPCEGCKAEPYCHTGHTGMIDWLHQPAPEASDETDT